MHPTIERLNSRKDGEYDDSTLALVIEGGGLRGALTAGMVACLQEEGYSSGHFDLIIGSSAGAFNAAYYISGNAEQGARLYPDHMLQNGFVDILGWLKGRPIMDLSVPLDRLLEEEVPLNWSEVVNANQLYIVVSDPHQVGTKTLEPPKDKSELKRNLRATAHIPVLAGKPPQIEGFSYYDGSLTAPLPIDQALALGATHVMALSSRNLSEWRNKQSKAERLISRVYDVRYPGIDPAIRKGVEIGTERARRFLEARDNPKDIPHIYTVDVPPRIQIRQFESNTRKLDAGIEIGRSAIQAVLAKT